MADSIKLNQWRGKIPFYSVLQEWRFAYNRFNFMAYESKAN